MAALALKCSACNRNKPKNAFSGTQLKKSKKRRCKQCIKKDLKSKASNTNIVSTTHTCSYCERTAAKSKCGGCKTVYYCNKICQQAHWKIHKKQCFFEKNKTRTNKSKSDQIRISAMNKERYSQYEEYIICCYLRDLSHLSVSKMNIPPIVVVLCLMYYVKDKWDVSCMANNTLLLASNCIKIVTGDEITTYLTNTVSNGQHAWIFQILRYPGSGVGPQYMEHLMSGGSPAAMVNIGIYKVKAGECKTNIILFKSDDGRGYGYNADFETLSDGREYGQYCNEGDTIAMILDMEDCTLSFVHNGKNYGIAFNIEKTDYKAAISVWFGSGVVIKLVDAW